MKRYYYLDRIQDFGVLWPCILNQSDEEKRETTVLISRRVAKTDVNVVSRLREKKICYGKVFNSCFLSAFFLKLETNAEFITASESNSKPHQKTLEWVKYAKSKGLKTITYQHGYENIGLTYSDQYYPCGKVHFESDEIRVWSHPSTLHPDISEETKSKIRFEHRQTFDLPICPADHPDQPIVGVFENLHWSRYGLEYRNSFIYDLKKIALEHPKVKFVLRSHIDELWLERQGALRLLPANVRFLEMDPTLTAVENTQMLLRQASAVITTPSTIAADAAVLDKPVAVVDYQGDAACYDPLLRIKSTSDWLRFSECIHSQSLGGELRRKSNRFLTDRLFSGDGTRF